MLSVDIVCVGKLSEKFFKDACAEYLKRLGQFYKITLTELPETKSNGTGAAEKKRIIESESNRILEHIDRKKGTVVAMCVEGEKLSSSALAAFIEKTAMTSSQLYFVIGGSLGLSETLKKRADRRLSVSDMTFPHQLFRVMLLEQIYRAGTINANVKYHK